MTQKSKDGRTVVLHAVHKMDRAGQETFLMNLFRSIDRSKVNFQFLCTGEGAGDFDEEILALGGKIHPIMTGRVRGKLKQLDNAYLLFRFLRGRRKEFQVFHIHTHHAMNAFFSALAAKLAGIPTVIVHSHNTSANYHLSAHKVFRKFLAALPVTRFACSEAAGHWLFGGKPFTVIHNAIDPAVFRYDPTLRRQVRKQMGWDGKFIIGHVGRFNKQKNHAYLLEIYRLVHKQMPEARLVLIGRGELEGEVRGKIAEYGLEDAVELLGVREDIPALYQGMDLFLFPSLFEGLPVTMVEAQASGLPCVISDTITRETDMTEDVFRMPLQEQPSVWAETIVECARSGRKRGDATPEIRAHGYDMKELAEKMCRFYCNGEVPQ